MSLNPSWQYAEHSAINSGCAVMYKATANRKNIVVGVNAGHGTSGGTSVKTLCHPDGSAKRPQVVQQAQVQQSSSSFRWYVL